ncbi:hypothetical protein ACQKJZ_04590 [Sphingomonas sp. NPDC019816]|uniref:hypothetical protein n=1 Tax=Sphingomonas sp. NPDC019816 TaxID=3390679 RepID=UPI003D049D95
MTNTDAKIMREAGIEKRRLGSMKAKGMGQFFRDRSDPALLQELAKYGIRK